jgi:hypothetical protein
MPAKSLSMPERALCRAQWEMGLSIADLSNQFGVSQRTLFRYRATDGWARKEHDQTQHLLGAARQQLQQDLGEMLESERSAFQSQARSLLEGEYEAFEERIDHFGAMRARIRGRLDRLLTEVETMDDDVPLAKRLTALKTANEVLQSLERGERASERASQNGDGHTLCEMLDELDRQVIG